MSTIMNAGTINELLNLKNTSEYIIKLARIAIWTYSIHSDENMISAKNNEFIEIESLTFYIDIVSITSVLKNIKLIKYNTDIIEYPIFQYFKNIVSNLEKTFIDLLKLHENIKTLFITTIDSNDQNILKLYNNIYFDIKSNTNINFSDQKFKHLNFKLLNKLIDLYKNLNYAYDLFFLLEHSFECYTFHRGRLFSVPINNYGSFSSVEDFRYYVKRQLCSADLILNKHWSEYLNATKIPIMLQSLIQDTDIIISKREKYNAKHMQMIEDLTLSKLKNMYFVLTILLDSYIDIVSNQLVLVVKCIDSYLFLSSILDHIINMKT